VDVHFARSSELGLTRLKTMAGFSIKEFSQPPYRRLPWHEHTDASICFVVSGSYSERLNGMNRECAPHSMIFKPAGERHADQFGRLGGTCLLIEVSPGRMETIEPSCDIAAKPSVVRNARLAALGHRIYGEFAASDPFSALAVEGLVLEVLVEGSRALVEADTTHRPRWLLQVRDLIHESAGAALTLSTIARAVGIHPSHLARTFRKHYRRSIGDYVRCLRIERASREIVDTSDSVAEIGVRSGFFDQSHFSRVFKEHTGLTPAQFRAASHSSNSRTNPRRAS